MSAWLVQASGYARLLYIEGRLLFSRIYSKWCIEINPIKCTTARISALASIKTELCPQIVYNFTSLRNFVCITEMGYTIFMINVWVSESHHTIEFIILQSIDADGHGVFDSHVIYDKWAQVEWWLEHRHGWLVKRQWARSWLGRVTRDEYQVLGSTSIPARLDTLVFWESFSWLTSVGTTRNTVNRLGWSRIGLVVLILNAAGAGLIGRPAVISGRYNKCHSLQLQNHYAHFPPLQHTHIHARHSYAELVVGNDHGFRGIVCWPWQEESCVIG